MKQDGREQSTGGGAYLKKQSEGNEIIDSRERQNHYRERLIGQDRRDFNHVLYGWVTLSGVQGGRANTVLDAELLQKPVDPVPVDRVKAEG
jgi:hypothetical protein